MNTALTAQKIEIFDHACLAGRWDISTNRDLLLLALSEHIDFGFAYLIGAITSISMISVYAGYAFKSRQRGAGLLVLLWVLFSLIYTPLKAEDFALLTGTLLGLLAIAGLMFVTKVLNAGNLEASSD